jgi:hypothetical protein
MADSALLWHVTGGDLKLARMSRGDRLDFITQQDRRLKKYIQRRRLIDTSSYVYYVGFCTTQLLVGEISLTTAAQARGPFQVERASLLSCNWS